MAVPGSSPDPRTLSATPADSDVRPVVALPSRGLPTPVLIALMVAGAILLLLVLESRRQSTTEISATAPGGAGAGLATPAPPLIVPAPVQPQAVIQPQPQIFITPQTAPAPAPRAPARFAPPSQPQIVYVPQPTAAPSQPAAPPQRVAGEPALVIDTTGGGSAPDGAAAAGEGAAAAAGGTASIAGSRSRAGVLANRTTTVAQGTLIPAVMETAFNSTRPGLARAIVSRDVRGFDGTRVLIPRGSRLVGEYRSDVQPGQRRALVNWIRLIRPDGATIAISSPATDPLGRGGIRANVNSHFFERFAGSLLRSTIDLGLTFAAGAANAPLVVLPGSVGGLGSGALQPREVQPTLTVRQGTSISVFVARDLDFTGVERRR